MCAVRSSAIVLPKDTKTASLSAPPAAELRVVELLGAGEACHHGGHGHRIGPVACCHAGASDDAVSFPEQACWSDVARSV